MAERRKLKRSFKIVKYFKDPQHPGRIVIRLEVTDPKEPEPYRLEFSIIKPQEGLLEIDNIIDLIKAKGIDKPVNPYEELDQAIESKQTFEI